MMQSPGRMGLYEMGNLTKKPVPICKSTGFPKYTYLAYGSLLKGGRRFALGWVRFDIALPPVGSGG